MIPDPSVIRLTLLAAALTGIAGVAVLRLAWARTRRSTGLNLGGWLLLAVGTVLGWTAAGAWGTAVAALAPMLAAMIVLAVAALGSQPGKQVASNRRAGLLPLRGEPLGLAGRSLTFALVVFVATVLAIGASVAMGGLALLIGAHKANAYATALFAMPIVWSAFAFALLMQQNRRAQWKLLAIGSVPTWPVLAIGLLT